MRFIKIFWIAVSLLFTVTACETGLKNSETANMDKNNSAINVEHRETSKSLTASDNYTRLGAAYLKKNNYEKALIKLQKAVRLNSENAKAYSYLGVLYWRLEQSVPADKYFILSRKISPYNAAINHNYASFLCSEKRYKEATKMFSNVFRNPLYDRLSSAYQVSADCDFDTLEFSRAEKSYKKALKIDKTNALAMLGMAKIYYKRSNYKISNYYLERYSKLRKHTSESLWLAVNLQRKLGDKNKLSSLILELKNIYPDSVHTLMFIEGKLDY